MFSKENRVKSPMNEPKKGSLSILESFKVSLSDKYSPESDEFKLDGICTATANMKISDDLFDDVVFKTIKDLQEEKRDYYFDEDVERFMIQLQQSQGLNLEAQSIEGNKITGLSTLLAENFKQMDEVDVICTGINHNSFFNNKSETNPGQYTVDAKWIKADGQAMSFAERNAARRAAKKDLNTDIIMTPEQNKNLEDSDFSSGYTL